MAEESSNQQDSVSDRVDVEVDKDVLEVKTTPKDAWPELVGLTVEEAEKKIKEDMPEVGIQVVLPDHFVTMDYNRGRVRLYVDSSGKVARPPTLG